MPTSRSWRKRAQRVLTTHLDRLQDTLTVLTQRLRETVAQAVSGSLAGALRETVLDLFAVADPGRASPSYFSQPSYRPRSSWGASHPYDEEAEETNVRSEDWPNEQARGWREVPYEPGEPTDLPPNAEITPARWYHALAVGCQAAAWWLDRPTSGLAWLAALGIGLLAAVVAFTAGGLAEAALNLWHMARALQAGTEALRWAERP
jgi:hypothetical protein